MRPQLAVPFLAVLIAVSAGCQKQSDSVSTQEPAPGSDAQSAAVERSTAEAARIDTAIDTVRAHWDSEVITGQMVDDIKKVLDQGSPADLAPLLDRIDLLKKSGAAYAPDFALWWQERGRNELGGKLFWRRDLLRKAINVALDEHDEAEALRLIHEAAATGDPVAQMWEAFADSELGGRHDAAALGQIMAMVDEARTLADNGDPEAALLLGMISADGDTDLTRATPEDVVRWLQTAADAGYQHARQTLADLGPLEMRGSAPAIGRARASEPAAAAIDDEEYRAAELRARSQNNLKQLALVGKMYANESRGERWPPLSAERGQLAMDVSGVYPEYLVDPNLYISPAHPKFYDLTRLATAEPSSAIRDDSYWYLGYAINDEATGLALVEHLREVYESGERPVEDLDAPEVDLKKIYLLREGIERFFIADINNPSSPALVQSQIPIMIERPGLHKGGANVLYLDGHVEFRRYPGEFPLTEAFIGALKSLDDLKVMATGGAFRPQ